MLKSKKVPSRNNVIYTAYSKKNFYYRVFISAFVLKRGKIPLNPFMNFDYFLSDTVNRNLVRKANNNMLLIANEVWVFGSISDGVLAEIKLAEKSKKRIRYFKIVGSKHIVVCKRKDLPVE